MKSTFQKGKIAENISVDFLKKNGYKILVSNFRTRRGEIDIIAQKKSTLHFIEVKSINSSFIESGCENITQLKKSRILDTAAAYLAKNPEFSSFDCQCDVITIDRGTIRYMPGAITG